MRFLGFEIAASELQLDKFTTHNNKFTNQPCKAWISFYLSHLETPTNFNWNKSILLKITSSL